MVILMRSADLNARTGASQEAASGGRSLPGGKEKRGVFVAFAEAGTAPMSHLYAAGREGCCRERVWKKWGGEERSTAAAVSEGLQLHRTPPSVHARMSWPRERALHFGLPRKGDLDPLDIAVDLPVNYVQRYCPTLYVKVFLREKYTRLLPPEGNGQAVQPSLR